jgi:hypothetical protein
VSPKTDKQKRTTATSKSSTVLTAEERAAMKELVQERKAQARGEDGERALLGKIAEMPEPDRAAKFKARYATFGFSDKANLDDGKMWPTYFALKELTSAEEKKIARLVKRAAG